MRIMGGSSNPALTSLVARKVGVKEGKTILEKFANGESRVQLSENVRGQDVYIIQTGGVDPNDAIVELLLMINACKLSSSQSVTVITPFFPYSKGDQRFGLRTALSSKLIANLLKKAGSDNIMMLDPHSPQLEGFFDHPVDTLQVEPLFCTWIRRNIPNWQHCVVVSPDEGGAKRSVSIANDLDLEFAMIHNRIKKSDTLRNSRMASREVSREQSVEPEQELDHPALTAALNDLQITQENVKKFVKISGDVSGMDCIVVDDMIDTGRTILLALQVLQDRNARNVYVFCTHGLFSSDALENLNDVPNLKKIVVTNSIPQEQHKAYFEDKIDVIDISGMIAEYIRRSHYKESVSVLSEFHPVKDLFRRTASVPDHQSPPSVEEGDSEDTRDQCQRLRRGFRLDSVCWD